MKITDKMRIDWLSKQVKATRVRLYEAPILFQPGPQFHMTPELLRVYSWTKGNEGWAASGRTPREAIDQAIKAERRTK